VLELAPDSKGEQRSCASSTLLSGAPPPHRPALKVTGDLDKGESRDGRSGNDFGTGFAGWDGGIDERPREEVFFAVLSSPISVKTEVTRGIRYARRPSRTSSRRLA
jgi:hypothetical protein